MITQFILNLVEGAPIRLVDGGAQKRCFTDFRDGIECLFRIVENKNGQCNRRIFNIGNPQNEYSMAALADMLREQFDGHALRFYFPPDGGIQRIEARAYYGSGYQDVQHQRPSIREAQRIVGWKPNVPFAQCIGETLDYFLKSAVECAAEASCAMPACE